MATEEHSIWESIKYLLGAGGIITLLVAFMKYVQSLGDRTRISDEAYILRMERRVEALEKEKKELEEEVERLRRSNPL